MTANLAVASKSRSARAPRPHISGAPLVAVYLHELAEAGRPLRTLGRFKGAELIELTVPALSCTWRRRALETPEQFSDRIVSDVLDAT